MIEKLLLFAVVALAFASVRLAEAQQAKVPKVGWLGVVPNDSTTSFESLRRELRRLGYVEGKNIAFEYRNPGNKLDRLPTLADELVRLRVTVLFAVPAPAAVAAKTATRTIPIVFVGGFDPVAAGLVESLAGTSPGSPALYRIWLASDWSYSRKPFPSSPALRRCGIHRIWALHNNGRKANCRREN
jgi:ABC-type uncharacterized transport system substrate-binding protein